MDEALGEEEVVVVFGVDVGDAPGIAEHLHRSVETGEAQGAFGLRPGASKAHHAGGGEDDGQEHEKQSGDADDLAQAARNGHTGLPDR